MVEIPTDRLFNALFELERRLPAQFALQLRRINGVTHVVTGAIGNKSDEVQVFAFLTAKQTIDRLNQYFDEVNVLPFVKATDIVGFGRLSLVEDQVDGTGVVLHVEPVAHILALTINWQWLTMANVVDKQRDELLGELERTVVVRAIGHDNRHSVSIVIGTNEVIAGSFGG